MKEKPASAMSNSPAMAFLLVGIGMSICTSPGLSDTVDMLVPSRTYYPGELLVIDEFFPKKFYVTSIGARNYVTASNQLLDAEAVRVLQSGKPVAIAFVRSKALVRKGQRTNGSFAFGGIVIEAPLVALADGRHGDVIAARNTETGGILHVRVRKDGSLEVTQK